MKVYTLLFLCLIGLKAQSQEQTLSESQPQISTVGQRKWEIETSTFASLTLGLNRQFSSGSYSGNRNILVIDFNYNFGFFQLGPYFSSDNYKLDTYKEETTFLGGKFRYNFIENKAGNNLIPYAKIGIFNGKNKEDVTRDYQNTEISFGLSYFPFNEYVCGDLFLMNINSKVKKSVGQDFTDSITKIGTSFSIYF